MLKSVAAFALVLAMLTGPLRAADAEDTIRWVYASLAGSGAGPKGLAYLAAPAQRGQYFTARMVAWFETDDTYRAQNLPGCWPHMFDVPGPAFDAAEIERTLTLSSTYAPDRQEVTASFSNLGQLARITFSFVSEDGFLRIDDVTGPGWQVSRSACQPWSGSGEAAESDRAESTGIAAYAGGEARFCYVTAGDRLRLEVESDGSAYLSLVSRQPTGHVCEAEGEARWTGRGWIHEPGGDGAGCALEILLTPRQGLRMRDPEYACKTVLCGPRAVLDGLQFQRADQVDCRYFGGD